MDNFYNGTDASSPLTFKKVVAFVILVYCAIFIVTGNGGLIFVALKLGWSWLKLLWAAIVWLAKGYAFLFPLIGTIAIAILFIGVLATEDTLDEKTGAFTKEIAALKKDIELLSHEDQRESALLRRVITQMKAMDERLRKLEPVPVETQESMKAAVEQFMEPR